MKTFLYAAAIAIALLGSTNMGARVVADTANWLSGKANELTTEANTAAAQSTQQVGESARNSLMSYFGLEGGSNFALMDEEQQRRYLQDH